MGDPVGIAQHAKTQLNEGGSVMIVEPFAFDTRAENHAALGGLLYGASAFLCTPCSLSQDVGRGMGAQSGEAGMRAVFEEAGYTSFRRAAETPFNIVYEGSGLTKPHFRSRLAVRGDRWLTDAVCSLPRTPHHNCVKSSKLGDAFTPLRGAQSSVATH